LEEREGDHVASIDSPSMALSLFFVISSDPFPFVLDPDLFSGGPHDFCLIDACMLVEEKWDSMFFCQDVILCYAQKSEHE
jgi:hypothetical protein